MAIYEFPYTNFHELNLDWVLSQVKKLIESNMTLTEAYETIIKNIDATLAEEIKKYFEDGTILELINNYYTEVEYKYLRYHNTDVYITKVPYTDDKGEMIPIFVADNGENGSPLTYAQEHTTTLSINATTGLYLDGAWQNPIVIGNGVVLNNNPMIDRGVKNGYMYLSFDKERNVKEYQMNTTSLETLVKDGAYNVFNVFWKIVRNGSAISNEEMVTYAPGDVTNMHPRQALGLTATNDIVIVTCAGRMPNNYGLPISDIQTLLLSEGCVNAWNLDGGGSVSTCYRTEKLNPNYDDGYRTDRPIRFSLNVAKENAISGQKSAFTKSSIVKQNLRSEIAPSLMKSTGLVGADANSLVGDVILGHGTGISNTPRSNGYLINVPSMVDDATKRLKLNKQVFIPVDYNKLFMRDMVDGSFGEWSVIGCNMFFDADNTAIQAGNYGYPTISTAINADYVCHLSNGNIVMDVSGVFNISFTCRIDGGSGTKSFRLFKNGLTIANSVYFERHEQGTAPEFFTVSTALELKKGDYIRFGVYTTTADNLSGCSIRMW